MAPSYSPRRPVREERLSLRGLEHRLLRWGEPGAAPIVLLHGFMDSALTWQFLVDCLPEAWSFIAIDWRGFGASERARDGYFFPDYLADLDALLDVVVPHEAARIIGHSMGGNVASIYAGVRQERLRWLVNLEGLGLARTTADMAPARYAQWLDQLREPPGTRRYDSLEQLVRILRMRNPRLSEENAAFIAAAWTRATGSGYELASDPVHARVNPVLYRREEAEACWRRITTPVLLLFGELTDHRGRLGADGSDQYWRSVYRGVRIITVPGVGHMMHHEDPAAVARHVGEFARELA